MVDLTTALKSHSSAFALSLVLIAWLSVAMLNTPPPSTLIRIAQAQAVFQPQGQALQQPPQQQSRKVLLRHRWDTDFPGLDGRATYQIELPESAVPSALLLERVGNQASIDIDGQAAPPLMRQGATTSSQKLLSDTNKRAYMVVLPPGARTVRIQASMQALRGGGLSPVWVGPVVDIEARYAQRRVIDEVLPAAYAGCLLLMGGLSAGLWLRQRDALFGCFSLAAFFGAIRHLDRVVPDFPCPWAHWGAVLTMAYGLHLVLIGRFVLLAVGRTPPWLERGFWGVLVAVPGLAALSFATRTPALWTGGLLLQLGFGLLCFVFVVRQAVVQRRSTVWFVLGAGSLLLLAGVHDIFWVRTTVFGINHEPWAPHALFAFVLLMAGMVVERLSASTAEVTQLNLTLTQRVAQREAQLQQAFEALRAQRDQEAMLNERQRITRDIHDGVGAHLVGLLSLVRQPQRRSALLEQHVHAALDELRMAVDALQPVHGDLTTVLATLRYRLQPRLQAAGIRVVWDVVALPLLDSLTPQVVLQVQRILLVPRQA
jgi:signal transduction histidine kinase